MPTTPFVVSDERLNSHGFTVLNSALNWDRFRANPVMLWMHERGSVIGQWENLRQTEAGDWQADPRFDEGDALGARIGGQVERGFLRACSIGIHIQDFRREPDDRYVVTQAEVLEISIVDIPSNSGTVRLYDQAGQPLADVTLAFRTAPTSQTIPTSMSLKPIATALSLADTATEQDVTAAIATLAARADQYEKKYNDLVAANQQAQQTEANRLIELAITEKRLDATKKGLFQKLFAADHESAKEALAELKAPVNVVAFAQQGAQAASASKGQTDQDAAGEWDKRQRDGSLQTLRADNPDEFKRLFKGKFGSEPAGV